MNGIDEYVFYLTDVWKMVTCDIMNYADAQEGHQLFDEILIFVDLKREE